jgi:hypothetical protein
MRDLRPVFRGWAAGGSRKGQAEWAGIPGGLRVGEALRMPVAAPPPGCFHRKQPTLMADRCSGVGQAPKGLVALAGREGRGRSGAAFGYAAIPGRPCTESVGAETPRAARRLALDLRASPGSAAHQDTPPRSGTSECPRGETLVLCPMQMPDRPCRPPRIRLDSGARSAVNGFGNPRQRRWPRASPRYEGDVAA